MEVNCFCFDWHDVQQRKTPQAIVDEMIHSEDVDYSKSIPNNIWLSDSAHQYLMVAEALQALISKVPEHLKLGTQSLSSLISEGNFIDDLGVSALTKGYYFFSLTPDHVSAIFSVIRDLDFAELAKIFEQTRSASMAKSLPDVKRDFLDYLQQWRNTISFAATNNYALLGHMG